MYYEFCIIYVVIVKNNSINNYFNKKVSNCLLISTNYGIRIKKIHINK